MSNMYGYNDYHGPYRHKNDLVDNSNDTKQDDEYQQDSINNSHEYDNNEDNNDDDDNDDPLRAGLWMEGDSLAPPCGTSIHHIGRILDFASITSSDVLYDLGCGDGRICLEAVATKQCKQAIGIELEPDLVDRGNHLISTTLPAHEKEKVCILQDDLRSSLSSLVRQVITNNNNNNSNNSKSKDPPSSIIDEDSDSATLSRKTKDGSGENDTQLPLPTVIIMYLLPDAIEQLEPELVTLLRFLPNNFRIVCNTWGLRGVKPSQAMELEEENGASSQIFLYRNKGE